MAITSFQELALPVSVSPDGLTDWMVRVKDVNARGYYLLNHCLYLGYIDNYPKKELYFDTELSAHDHAHRFYSHHGLTYPHMGYLIKLHSDKLNKLTKQSSDSQIMEFE